jgi:hypothetical protein
MYSEAWAAVGKQYAAQSFSDIIPSAICGKFRKLYVYAIPSEKSSVATARFRVIIRFFRYFLENLFDCPVDSGDRMAFYREKKKLPA